MINPTATKRPLLILILVFILGIAGNLTDSSLLAMPAAQASELTPLQQNIADTFNQRAQNNLPVPAIDFQSGEFSAGSSLAGIGGAEPITMTSSTVIHFSGPEQAGFEQWPAVLVLDSFDEQYEIVEVDKTTEYRQVLEQYAPGVLQQYEFGYEPRTLRITERLVYEPATSPLTSLAANQVSTREGILMGFTYTGPDLALHYEPSFSLCPPVAIDCFTLVIGYELDWALGLRLPAAVTLSGPNRVSEWGNYSVAARLTPLNWSAGQYTNVGVAGEKGNEFVARFTARVFAELSGPFIGTQRLSRGVSYNGGRSFQTPFGPNARFPVSQIENIPLVSIPVVAIPVFGMLKVNLGAGLNFLLSSSNITAEWQVVAPSGISGQGEVTFSSPAETLLLGQIQVNDVLTDEIEVELKNFRYWFNEFETEVFLNVSLTLETLFGPVSTGRHPIHLFSVDLSSIFGGLGLSVGGHLQCTWNLACVPQGPDNVLRLTTLFSSESAVPVLNYYAGDTVTLRWQQINWAVNYQIQIADNAAFQSASAYFPGSSLQYTTPSLPNGLYYWRVRAQQANGNWGAWSQAETFIIDVD